MILKWVRVTYHIYIIFRQIFYTKSLGFRQMSTMRIILQGEKQVSTENNVNTVKTKDKLLPDHLVFHTVVQY